MRARFLNTQVTCAKLLHPFLLIGEGSWLHIYRLSEKDSIDVARLRIFTSASIHGVEPIICESNLSYKLIAYGGRNLRILLFNEKADPKLVSVSEAVSFQDWIWDVKWLENDHIGLVLAHNYAILYDTVHMKVASISHCKEKCILYCGILVGKRWSEVAVLAGTVFQQILIWCPYANYTNQIGVEEPGQVLHRLTGHDGVIFSICYDDQIHKLCTCSDDRSIQIWHHELSPGEPNSDGTASVRKKELSAFNWSKSNLKLQCKLYGHDSRVWKVQNFGTTFVSVGEDSHMCFWKYGVTKGTWLLDHKILCHGESSVRGLDVDQDNKLLVTSGGNGEVKLWHLIEHSKEGRSTHHRLGATSDKLHQGGWSALSYPRDVRFLNFDDLMITTNDGALLRYNIPTSNVTILLQDSALKSYCLVDIKKLDNEEVSVCIGDLMGGVSFLWTGRHKDSESFLNLGRHQVCNGKVMALKQLHSGLHSLLLVCGPDGHMVLYDVQIFDERANLSIICLLELPVSRQRWFSTAAVLDLGQGILSVICGGRNGSIHVFSPVSADSNQGASCDLVQCFSKIHGSNGVTGIYMQKLGNMCYTTGRDGFLRTYDTTAEGTLRLLNKNWVAGFPKWIAGVKVIDDDTLVLGFHTDHFIVWSEKNQSVLLQLACGGGHRSWDFIMSANGARFCYIKERGVEYYDTHVHHSIPICIKAGLHHRQICSIHHLFSQNSVSYLATSSEDTTVQIVRVREHASQNVAAECVTVLKSHISSVKSVASCRWKEGLDDQLLVTVGGRAQMVCWRLHTNCEGQDKPKLQELVSHMLHPEGRRSKKPWQNSDHTFDPETRYMDAAVWPVHEGDLITEPRFLIAVACSDSYIRIFNFCAASLKIEVQMEDSTHGHCALKVKLVYAFPGRSLLLSTATDGQILFWDPSSFMEGSSSECRSTNEDADILVNSGIVDTKTFPSEKSKLSSHRMESPSVRKAPSCLTFAMCLHQSGVTALDVIAVASSLHGSSRRMVVATGGDDTAVLLCLVDVTLGIANASENSVAGRLEVSELSRTPVPASHTAQVTGVCLTPQFLWTASVDRRVTLWQYDFNSSGMVELKQLAYYISNIADISSLCGWLFRKNANSDEDAHYLAVAGQGMEILDSKVAGQNSVS